MWVCSWCIADCEHKWLIFDGFVIFRMVFANLARHVLAVNATSHEVNGWCARSGSGSQARSSERKGQLMRIPRLLLAAGLLVAVGGVQSAFGQG